MGNNTQTQTGVQTDVRTAPSAEPSPLPPETAPPPGPGASLDRVRDILFGGRSQELDDRIKGTEERVHRDVAELSKSLGARVDQLERYFKQELRALSTRLDDEKAARIAREETFLAELENLRGNIDRHVQKSRSERDDLQASLTETGNILRKRLDDEKSDRGDAVDTLSSKVEETRRTLSEQLGNLRNTQDDAAATLRESLLELGNGMRRDLEAEVADMLDLIRKEAAGLQDSKADRRALASMLSDVAARLVAEQR